MRVRIHTSLIRHEEIDKHHHLCGGFISINRQLNINSIWILINHFFLREAMRLFSKEMKAYYRALHIPYIHLLLVNISFLHTHTHTSDSNLFKNVSDSRLYAGLCVSSTVCIFHISFSIKMAGKHSNEGKMRWIMKEFLIYTIARK